MPTKPSNALLAAWFVVIAGLVAAIVYFSLKGGNTAPVEADPPTTPVAPGKRVEAKTSQPRHPDRNAPKTPHTNAPPKRSTIEGVIRIPGGEPAAGAHVALFEPNRGGKPSSPPNVDELRLVNQLIYIPTEESDTPRRLEDWTGDADRGSGADAEIASDDTKADGTFKITLPSRFSTGPFRLTATKPGVGAAVAQEVSPDGERVELVLGPATSVKGVVITEVDSAPVPNATVVFDNGARRFVVHSDAEGKFTAEGVGPGIYRLSVAAKGKVPLFESHYKVEAAVLVPITLRMPRGTKIVVKTKVESDDPAAVARAKDDIPGDPVPNAEIVLFNEDMNVYVLGRSNQEGVAEFPGMPAGSYAMNARAKDFVSTAETAFVVPGNQMSQEETALFEKAVYTPVEVVDEDGRAVSGMDFFTVNNEDKYDQVRSMKIGTTDGDGKMKFPFEFDGPRSKLFGIKSGFAVIVAVPEDKDSGEALKLVAKKPIRVHGTVKTPDDKPVPDALVMIEVAPTDPNAEAFEDYSLSIRADANGRYDFGYLPRVEGITVGAAGPDGITQEDKDIEFTAGKFDYEIDLSLDLDEEAVPVVVQPTKKATPAEEQKK